MLTKGVGRLENFCRRAATVLDGFLFIVAININLTLQRTPLNVSVFNVVYVIILNVKSEVC